MLVFTIIPFWATDAGMFPQNRPGGVRRDRIGFWLAIGIVVAALQLMIEFDLEMTGNEPAQTPVWMFIQIGVPIVLREVFEALLRRRLGEHARVPLHLAHQRHLIGRTLTSLELGIARQELLQERLHLAVHAAPPTTSRSPAVRGDESAQTP